MEKSKVNLVIDESKQIKRLIVGFPDVGLVGLISAMHIIETLNMKEIGYIEFPGQSQNWFLSRIGDSYLYDVPLNKQGRLKPFRGHRVRVICIGSGKRFERMYMAGAV